MKLQASKFLAARVLTTPSPVAKIVNNAQPRI